MLGLDKEMLQSLARAFGQIPGLGWPSVAASLQLQMDMKIVAKTLDDIRKRKRQKELAAQARQQKIEENARKQAQKKTQFRQTVEEVTKRAAGTIRAVVAPEKAAFRKKARAAI